MPYMDETGLAYYSGKLKPWIASQPVKTVPPSFYPWTLTEKAWAVSFWSAGDMPLAIFVEFKFKEFDPSFGTKSPSNPSTIEGMNTINVYHCNSNMLKYPYQHSSGSTDGVTVTVNDDKSITINGSRSSNFYFRLDNWFPFEKGFTYYQTSKYINKINNSGNLRFYTDPDYGSAGNGSGPGSAMVMPIDIPSNVKKIIAVKVYANTPASDLVVYPSVSCFNYTGPWEAPNRVEKAISLGSTFYGGTLDVAMGILTVTYGMVEPLSGTVDISDHPALLPLEYADTYGRTVTSADGTSLSIGSSGGRIVYKLATPYTVQLDPVSISALTQSDKYTPRLNTVYTDAQSVQVGYVKSPIREEYELQQAIVAQGGNI